MKPAPQPSAFPPEIEAAAVRWLGLRDAGELTAEQEQEFDRWIEADPRHVEAYASLEAVWDRFDVLPAGMSAPQQAVAPALIRFSVRRWLAPALAAAAVLTVSVITWRHSATPALLVETASTEVGAQRTLELPDGSVIRLNTDTEVTVDYGPAVRRVRLRRGEAHFTVAKNKARPFIVAVQSGERAFEVRAVGTAFNVRLDPTAVEVLVTEGRVAVDNTVTGEVSTASPPVAAPVLPAIPLFLDAGHRVLLPMGPGNQAAVEAVPAVTPVAAPEVERALAWRTQRLEFEDEPLAVVVAEFNRYNRHKLVIADPRLAAQRFGGKFRPDGYEGLIRLLESSFGVTAERKPGETVLRLP